jgi:5-methylcytosine-specific restriction endonuclease McrA
MTVWEEERRDAPTPLLAGRDEARRLAMYMCCVCHDEMGDDVHHLQPKAQGGLGILENAILLCVRCHAIHGSRPEKQAQLRGARDLWYDMVSRKSAAEITHIERSNSSQRPMMFSR